MTAPAGTAEEVRAAVATYLSGGAVPNLAIVLRSPPFDEGEIDWNTLLAPGALVMCFGVVFLEHESDEDISLDGAGGRRVCTYDVTLELFFQDISGDAIAAQGRLDNIITGVKQRLRTDPRLGTGTADPPTDIIQAAVAKLEVERGRPERYGEGDTFGAWTGIKFTVDSYEYAT